MVDPAPYTRLLARFVRDGVVDYRAWRADEAALGQLREYLAALAAADPAGKPAPARLAFWLNAYNASTLDLVLRHYPVAGIKEIGDGLFGSPWGIRFAAVAGKAYTLDEIEHEIIRPQFRNPLIHFAANCAARSCPELRAEAYTAADLSRQLEDQARLFIRNPALNTITPGPDGTASLELSPIFKWYGDDFAARPGGLAEFLAGYAPPEAAAAIRAGRYETRYRDYDWSLNERR